MNKNDRHRYWDCEYILINFYNAYTETEQLNALDDLMSLLSTSELICVKRKLLTGHFNLFFNFTLETKGRDPSLKTHSLRELVEIKET